MRMLRVTISLGCVFFCSQPAVAQEAFDIAAFAEAFMAAEKLAWEQDDFSALEALEHPDVVFQNIDGTVIRGREAHKQAIMSGYNNAPITQEWRYLMGEGNMFAIAYKWAVRFPEQTLNIEGIVVGRVRDGKLVEEWGAGHALPRVASE